MSKVVLFALTVSVLLISFVPLFAEQESGTWLTVRRYEGVTDTKEAARVVQEGFVPLISKLPGFIAYYFVDAGNNVMISVSVYTNKEAEEGSNRIAADFVKQHMTHLYPNPPRITAGHVVAIAPQKK
jgi:hypothetical protein